MSERLRRISIIGVCVTALFAVAILPLQADAKSKPVAKTAAAKQTAAARAKAARARAARARAAKAKAAKAAATNRARARFSAAQAAAAKAAAAQAAAAAAALPPANGTPIVAPIVPPVVPPVVPPAPAPAPCVGVAMTSGQADIDAAGTGTTFCLSGTHNWTLTPKSGDQLIGPAVLDGGNSTQFAITGGSATNVVLSGLEIRNYRAMNQQGAIYAPQGPTGWVLRDLQVHDNGTSAGGAGASLGPSWQVVGGRYYNNRQLGLAGAGGNDTVNGAEIDHNNFTDDSYTRRNIDCSFEAGGFKWLTDNITVENSKIHDNACRGLWVDGSAQNAKILNNEVYNNWDEGIFIEISSYATITGNTVYNNGQHCYQGSGNGCIWVLGAGIGLLSSDHVEIAYNTLYGNVNGITGVESTRTDGHPGVLQNDSIHDNSVTGPGGKTGLVTTNGGNLGSLNITFANNTFGGGMNFCNLTC